MARLEAAVRQRGGRARDKRQRFRSVAELVALGETLMRRGSEAGCRGRESQLAYRDGLMIALLALRPLRLRNLTALTLGESLRRQGNGWWIVLSEEATKNRQPLELPFPDRLVLALEGYLDRVRPLLLEGRIDQGPLQALWISLRATAMSPASVYEQITMRTAQAFGYPINPHLFCDCAATSMALADPSLVRAGAPLLGHASFATTERHYNLARAADAARGHQTVVQALRAAGGKQRR
jgi:integrase